MKLVVLISGRGSNLKAIIDKMPDVEIVAVISNNPNAFGLQYAKLVNAQEIIVDHTKFGSREAFDQKLIQIINQLSPDLVVLAGFMRILSKDFVNQVSCKIINIHPSLLPKYKGLNTHKRVLEAGDKYHGATVHFVTSELDSGETILQRSLKVKDNDTEDSLAARVLKLEHKLYSDAINKLIVSGDLI